MLQPQPGLKSIEKARRCVIAGIVQVRVVPAARDLGKWMRVALEIEPTARFAEVIDGIERHKADIHGAWSVPVVVGLGEPSVVC